jgi:hypothetical protein
LKGLSDYQVSRWGVCFCLNTADWMGSSVVSSGNTYSLAQDISPQRVLAGVIQGLFPASNEMHFLAPDSRYLKVVSIGQVLEAEDQRNWTDNTYKIYSGSLKEPRPFTTSPGSSWKQNVNFEVGVPKQNNADPTKMVTFTSVVLSDPRYSGLSSVANGKVSRIHFFVRDVSAAIDQHANPCSIAQMQHAYAMRTILHHRANIQTISDRSIYSAGPALPGATVHC